MEHRVNLSLAPNSDRYLGLVFEARPRRHRHEMVPPQRRAPQLGRVTEDVPGDIVPGDVAQFLRLALAKAGLDDRLYRITPLIRRLPACLRALGVGSLEGAQQLLQAEPSRWSAAIDALLIGTTSFFRDRPVFDTLARLLPGLHEGRGGLRVWSIGCSDGAELYSVALLLAELNVLAQSHFRGTDCRPAAIERARTGRFHVGALATTPPDLRRKYFQVEWDHLVLSEDVRRRAEWDTADALRCQDPGAWDLILCRNLAIYIDPGSVRRLWAGLSASLRAGGILIVGKAERPATHPPLQRIAPCIYVKERG